MRRLKGTFLALAAVGVFAGHAMAADIPQVYEPAPLPETVYYDESGWYIRGDIGWSFLDSNFSENDDAFTGGGGVGYRFNRNFRFDVTGDYSGKFDTGPQDLNVWTILGNAYVDIPVSETVTPYLGAGAGYGWADFSPGSSEDGFAFALMAGVGFDIAENVTLDVGYRFRDVAISGPDPIEHQIRAGIRFGF